VGGRQFGMDLGEGLLELDGPRMDDALPRRLPEKLFATLLDPASVRVERIVSHGHASPKGLWYNQDRHAWVIVPRRSFCSTCRK
jgi:hypothetical protein